MKLSLQLFALVAAIAPCNLVNAFSVSSRSLTRRSCFSSASTLATQATLADNALGDTNDCPYRDTFALNKILRKLSNLNKVGSAGTDGEELGLSVEEHSPSKTSESSNDASSATVIASRDHSTRHV
jgi:hypothetical protein